MAQELPDNVALALFNALQVDNDKRTATIAAFRDQLSAAPAVSALLEDEPPAPPPPPEKPEPAQEEPPKPKNSRTKYAVLIVIAVFVMLLLLAGGVILLMFPEVFQGSPASSEATSYDLNQFTSSEAASSEYVPPEKSYAVEDVTGKNYFQEKDKSFRGDMKLEVKYLAYSNQPEGTILDQDPKPETPVKEGTTIYVVISAGTDELTVPDVAGWKAEHAQAYLEALGFKVTTVQVEVSDYEKGLVQETDPPAGTKKNVGDTITLRVSNVEPTTTAPPTEPTAEPTEPDSGYFPWW